VPHLELNLAPAAEDMPDMAIALIRAIIAAADKDRDEMGRALAVPGRSLEVVQLPRQLAGADDVPVAERQAELAAFCVVASIAAETAHGEGGLELRRGVKHFPPGAKVWVLPPQ
jgi:hypothetical protein